MATSPAPAGNSNTMCSAHNNSPSNAAVSPTPAESRLTAAIVNRYGNHRPVRCTVTEDGILGGGVRWHPDPPGSGR